MKEFIKDFLHPETKTYHYPISKDEATAKLKSVFSKKDTLMNGFDITGGLISENEFEYDLISHAMTYGAKYSATMYGKILNSSDETAIFLKPNHSWTIYGLLIISILASVASLIKFFESYEIQGIVFFFGFLLLGPKIIIGISQASISALY